MKMNLNLKKEAGKVLDFMDEHTLAVVGTVMAASTLIVAVNYSKFLIKSVIAYENACNEIVNKNSVACENEWNKLLKSLQAETFKVD